jgi:hypothetical protein
LLLLVLDGAQLAWISFLVSVLGVDTRGQVTMLAIILMRVQVDVRDERLDPMADLRL